MVNGWAWDKLIKVDLLKEYNLTFLPLRRNEDMVISYMSLAMSRSFKYVPTVLIHHRRNTSNSAEKSGLDNPFTFYEAGLAWIKLMKKNNCLQECHRSYANRMLSAIWYTISMCKSNSDLDDSLFCHLKTYMLKDLMMEGYPKEYFYPFIWKTYDKFTKYISPSYSQHFISKYANTQLNEAVNKEKIMATVGRKKVIISLTSYPARIQYVKTVIESLLNQSITPDKIILWLAEDQFKDTPVPKELKDMDNGGIFNIRYCCDLKSHKKYYYTMIEYPNDIVVTVDDDVAYDPNMLYLLLTSYNINPKAISALRVHKITIDESENIAPYSEWVKEYPATPLVPRMDLIATGVAGVLYPPHSLPKEAFDIEAITNTCLYEDDVWLKIMEMRNNVPTVLASSHKKMNIIPESQNVALYHRNIGGGGNDESVKKIMAKYPVDLALLRDNYVLKKRTLNSSIGKLLHKVRIKISR